MAGIEDLRRQKRESYHRRKHDPGVKETYKRRNAERHTIRQYGRPLSEKFAVLATQGGRCKTCPATNPGTKKGWHWDHNHKTGEMLGVLCHHCNVALGQAQHNPERLMSLAIYARQYHGVS